LTDVYQAHTEADLSRLRAVGCELEYSPVDAGVRQYLDWLNA